MRKPDETFFSYLFPIDKKREIIFLSELQEDPYNSEEPNPVKSKAIESSLWELKVRPIHVFILFQPQLIKGSLVIWLNTWYLN